MNNLNQKHRETGCEFAILLVGIFLSIFILGCDDDFTDSILLQGDSVTDEISEGFEGVNQNLSVVLTEEQRLTRGEINQEGNDRAEDDRANTDRIIGAINGSEVTEMQDQLIDTENNEGEEENDSTFLWKPISEGDGNLVVLTPFNVDASSMVISGDFGFESGRFTGRSNGNRPTFRFSTTGCGYGQNITVETNVGQSYFIDAGCKRVEIN